MLEKDETKFTLDRATNNAPPAFNVKPEVYKEIAQSLLLAQQSARSIENGTSAFMPLASGETRDILLRIAGHSQEIHRMAKEIYDQIALTAFNS